MAGNELIVDDGYCDALSTYVGARGEQLDAIIAEYITILQEVGSSGIISGEISEALGSYIGYAQMLSGKIGSISTEIKKEISNFLEEVDEEDQFLF